MWSPKREAASHMRTKGYRKDTGAMGQFLYRLGVSNAARRFGL